jgi:hypothetical protein
MLLNTAFERFAKNSPVAVMVRGLLEQVLDPTAVNALFDEHAQKQYTRELLFSDVVDVMGEVVCGSQRSVNAGYRAHAKRLGVSRSAFYQKLNGIEPQVSAALVRQTATNLAAVVDQLGGALPPLLPGYRVKILDGNALAKTEHRLRELRTVAAGPLPGKALVVLDPASMLVIHVFPCADGHTQERALLDPVLATVEPNDLWIEDRNFCTLKFLFGVATRQACFIVRQHQNLPWQTDTELEYAGTCDSGEVWEQRVRLTHPDTGEELLVRRVELRLRSATRDGDMVIHLLTNLPARAASARVVAQLYRERWTIEGAFQILEATLESEQPRLGYPSAALFAFGAVHGRTIVEENVSTYYLAAEIQGVYQGMMIAIPPAEWQVWQKLTVAQLAVQLKALACAADLSAYQRSRRGPKKPRPQRIHCKSKPHVSTARLIANRRNKKRSP